MSPPLTHILMVSPIERQSPSSLDSQKSLLMDGLTESGEASSHWLSNLRRSSCFLQLLNSSCLNFPGMAFQLLHYWSTNLNSLPPASQSDFLFSYLDIALARKRFALMGIASKVNRVFTVGTANTSCQFNLVCGDQGRKGMWSGRLSIEKLNLHLSQQGTRMPCQMLLGQEIGLLACSQNCDTNVS